jgi:tetratricopeptide (TPR) repeat protein
MTTLGSGLYAAGHHEDELSVRETELAMLQRLGVSERSILIVQGNLANTYRRLGRLDDALRLRREVYSGLLNLNGEEHIETFRAANNYALSLVNLKRFEEAKSLMRKTMPVARRVLGSNNEGTLRTRTLYAAALHRADGATLDDLREAVTTLQDAERTARRVLGGAHPLTEGVGFYLRDARAALRARETPPSPPSSESV